MKRELLLAIGLLVLTFVIALLTQTTPPVPNVVTHASGDVRPGGYAAWDELLAREGLRTGQFRAPHEDLGADGVDTLIVAFPAEGVPTRWDQLERDGLRTWVRAGGRLIDVGPWPRLASDEVRHPLLALRYVSKRGGALRGPWVALVGTLGPRGSERIVRTPRVRGQVTTLLRDAAGALVVRYREGRGEVIAVWSAAPFENGALARAGNARLASLIAVPRRHDGRVDFDETIRDDVIDRPWYRALEGRELLALAFLALAGLAWLAYGLLPLGPPVRLVAPREPTSEEFLDAFAALYGRAHARARAADALLADATRRLERAPRTPEVLDLTAQVEHARDVPSDDDRSLVALAVLSRSVREETIRGGDPARRSGAFARRLDPRRRRR
ncbi:MAG: DUF4350 domain-containing protein [Vulcanimicrobiaceae bacterium]